MILAALLSFSVIQSTTSFQIPPKTRFVSDFIVGGEEVEAFKYPWIVSINAYNGHFCGGSLISDQWLVTAAHCTLTGFPMEDITIEARRHNIRKTANEEKALTYSVLEQIIHPEYNSRLLTNDIAVWKISSQFPLQSAKIGSVQSKGPGSVLHVAGWGATEESGYLSPVLLQVDVPLFDHAKCRDIMGDAISNQMICAGGEEGKDSCQGDSGGPLMSNNELLGIVSWGFGCARAGFPGIYTNVSYYKSWIEGIIHAK